jgi:hypothetical protein
MGVFWCASIPFVPFLFVRFPFSLTIHFFLESVTWCLASTAFQFTLLGSQFTLPTVLTVGTDGADGAGSNYNRTAGPAAGHARGAFVVLL